MWESKGIRLAVLGLVLIALLAVGACKTNTPPDITSVTPSAESIAPGGSCNVSCVATDVDEDALTYEWTASGGTISGTGNSVSWEAPAAEDTYTVNVEVSDGKGGTDSESVDIIVEMKYGAIEIWSDPAEAVVFLNGVDTGEITPCVLTNLTPGSHTVRLEVYGHKYREQTVTVTANDTTLIEWMLPEAPRHSITIQPDGVAGIDSFVSTQTPSQNFGNSPDLYAGASDMGTCRLYMQFSLDSLPENAVVEAATLGLFYFYSYPEVDIEIGLYPVLEAWTETDITWDNQPASSLTTEYLRTIRPLFDKNEHYPFFINDLVISWWDGSQDNFGLVLKSADESALEGWAGFYSSDCSMADWRPRLFILYFDPTS